MRIVKQPKKRRWLIASLPTLFLLLIITFTLWEVMDSRTFQFFGRLVSRVNTNEKVVALTFDDGPTSQEKANAILEALREPNVPTTFFVIGQDIKAHPELAQQLVSAGHQLANHTYSHQRMILKSPSFIQEEVEKTDALIRQAGYQGEILFRPPNGKKLFGLPFYLGQHQRITITWDIEPESEKEVLAVLSLR